MSAFSELSLAETNDRLRSLKELPLTTPDYIILPTGTEGRCESYETPDEIIPGLYLGGEFEGHADRIKNLALGLSLVVCCNANPRAPRYELYETRTQPHPSNPSQTMLVRGHNPTEGETFHQLVRTLPIYPPAAMEDCAPSPMLSAPESTLLVFNIAADDDPNFDLSPFFFEASEMLERIVLERKGRALVHCAAGISRSATVLIAFLMKVTGCSRDDVLSLVCSRRRWASPNPGFMNQLTLWEVCGCTRLQGRDSVDCVVNHLVSQGSSPLMAAKRVTGLFSALLMSGSVDIDRGYFIDIANRTSAVSGSPLTAEDFRNIALTEFSRRLENEDYLDCPKLYQRWLTLTLDLHVPSGEDEDLRSAFDPSFQLSAYSLFFTTTSPPPTNEDGAGAGGVGTCTCMNSAEALNYVASLGTVMMIASLNQLEEEAAKRASTKMNNGSMGTSLPPSPTPRPANEVVAAGAGGHVPLPILFLPQIIASGLPHLQRHLNIPLSDLDHQLLVSTFVREIRAPRSSSIQWILRTSHHHWRFGVASLLNTDSTATNGSGQLTKGSHETATSSAAHRRTGTVLDDDPHAAVIPILALTLECEVFSRFAAIQYPTSDDYAGSDVHPQQRGEGSQLLRRWERLTRGTGGQSHQFSPHSLAEPVQALRLLVGSCLSRVEADSLPRHREGIRDEEAPTHVAGGHEGHTDRKRPREPSREPSVSNKSSDATPSSVSPLHSRPYPPPQPSLLSSVAPSAVGGTSPAPAEGDEPISMELQRGPTTNCITEREGPFHRTSPPPEQPVEAEEEADDECGDFPFVTVTDDLRVLAAVYAYAATASLLPPLERHLDDQRLTMGLVHQVLHQEFLLGTDPSAVTLRRRAKKLWSHFDGVCQLSLEAPLSGMLTKGNRERPPRHPIQKSI
jgi:hypothetical protein